MLFHEIVFLGTVEVFSPCPFFSFKFNRHLPPLLSFQCVISSWLKPDENNRHAKPMQRMFCRYSHEICFDIVVDDVSFADDSMQTSLCETDSGDILHSTEQMPIS